MNNKKISDVIFKDDFSSYPESELLDVEYLSGISGGRKAEENKNEVDSSDLMQRGKLGPWEQTTLHYAWRSERFSYSERCVLPWKIISADGRHWLCQPESFHNVMLKAGNPEWTDYSLECKIAVSKGPAGPVVRYRTSRHNYWLCFEAGEPVRLIRRRQDKHVILAQFENFAVEEGVTYCCKISCSGSGITVSVEDEEISVKDVLYDKGNIALRTEGPCRFTDVIVTALKIEREIVAQREKNEAEKIFLKRSAFPKARLVHTVKLPGNPSVVRVDDVNDDGRPEFVCCDLAVPAKDYIQNAATTVLDWEGKELWRVKSDETSGKYKVHGSFALNSSDIDSDGRTEVILTQDFRILILDGATGRIKQSAPTPRAFLGGEDYFDRVVGDSIIVCNLRGLECPQDFILKDRYENLWAYTSDMKPLWHRRLNTGHYPRVYDINGDGKDEVMAGYSMLASDGVTMWTVKGADPFYNRFPGPEHVDSILIGRFRDGGDSPVEIAMAASDFGFILLDADGAIKARAKVGHAQHLGAGKFRPDLPGRQFAVKNLWGDQGIISLIDQNGEILLAEEISESFVEPVNWTGDGRALLRFRHGLADGNFHQVVDLPPYGGTAPFSLDYNGEGVDKIFVRRGETLEIYAPERVPANPSGAKIPGMTNWDRYGGFIL